MRRVFVGLLAFIGLSWFSFAQEGEPGETPSPPPISALRAEESYTFLDSVHDKLLFLQPLKWMRLGQSGKVTMTLGGEYRARLEHFTNKDYTDRELTYYSQRMDLHAALRLGTRIRLFAEIYSGWVSAADPIFLESDAIDLHQGFLEWKPLESPAGDITVRLGRQEIGYGASRLVGIREGPNMRRSFDLARVIVRKDEASIDFLYGKEVDISRFAFDNKSSLFDAGANNPELWGVYFRRPFLKDVGKLDVYYFGFRVNSARFNDVIGKEVRHSLGVRSFGQKGRLTYNTEFVLQLGQMANTNILAYNLETDWAYELIKSSWRPTLGIKIDWSSGDAEQGDDRLGTFNPMFVNPAIYSLAAVNTPANITSLHPNFTFYPTGHLSVNVDYAFFYRTRIADGLYTPPRFLIREAIEEVRHIGDVFGLQVRYQINRNISFDLRCSYFIAGQFLEATGDANNTFYIAPTIDFKF